MRWLLVGLFALALLAACSEPSPSEFEELTEVPAECSVYGLTVLPDGVSIANEILGEETDDLEFDQAERDALASEIEGVLVRVRAELPVAAEMHALYTPLWQLGLELTKEASARALDNTYTQVEGVLARHLGSNAVDSLSEMLGVKAMRVGWSPGTEGALVDLCLDDTVNVPEAAEEYEQLEDVKSAGPSGLIGDSAALDMRKRDGAWFVVVREAGGDCPAGCTEETLHFLRVDDGGVQTIAEAEAANDPLFEKLVGLTRSGSPWASPSP